MDARAQLRRYLEQRREAGERDLVLDGMSVDEALRALGATEATEATEATPGRASEPRSERRVVPADATGPTDWREVLRGAGAEPDPVDAIPVSREPASPRPPVVRGPVSLPAGIAIGGGEAGLFGGGPLAHLATLEDVAGAVASCTLCPLHKTATNPVPGTGNAIAELMVVGEAPGETEDQQGKPFVGAAGQLLTKILAAVEFKRDDVFIVNVLKHRPPGNRNPAPDEVTACRPYLARQFEIVRPRIILALGTFAAQTLLETKLAIGKLRGQLHRYHGVPLIVTYHPAALLRNPSWKRPTWEDVQLVRRILDSGTGQS